MDEPPVELSEVSSEGSRTSCTPCVVLTIFTRLRRNTKRSRRQVEFFSVYPCIESWRKSRNVTSVYYTSWPLSFSMAMSLTEMVTLISVLLDEQQPDKNGEILRWNAVHPYRLPSASSANQSSSRLDSSAVAVFTIVDLLCESARS